MRFTLTLKGALACVAIALAACTTASPPTNTAANRAGANVNNTNASITPTGSPAPTPPTAASNIPYPEIRRIEVAEAQSLAGKNEAVFVDTRGESAYQTGHIKGALNITSANLQARLAELPRDKRIITYCS